VDRPTKAHTPDTAGNHAPLPGGYLDGLGEMQTQHTCILLEDVVETCNLRCPTCFADSSPSCAASCRWSRSWPTSTSGWPGRTAGSTC